MIGKQDRRQDELFVACRLRDLIPDEHILKRVDKVLELSWLREEVKDCYCVDTGRPAIDPEAAVRLMLAGLFQGIVHDRKLMREAQVNLAIRWFAGYRLDAPLPDHSSLTRIRQRWGPERFRRIFQRTVAACVEAGLVNGETVHVDATLIRADVSWASLTERHVAQVLKENRVDDGPEAPRGGPGPGGGGGGSRKSRKYSTTDPDATLAPGNKTIRMEPSFKQHTAVDDQAGVIVDVAATTGQASEGAGLRGQLERVQAQTGRKPKTVTADAAYAHSGNYAALENAGVDAVIPPQSQQGKPRRIPARRFQDDGQHQRVRCPAGKLLRRSHWEPSRWVYRARACDCRGCPLRRRCLPPSAKVRTIAIAHGQEALLRARRRHQKGWDPAARQAYARHRWRAEGVHGEAKRWHGLGRAPSPAAGLRRLTGSFRVVLGCLRRPRHARRRLEQPIAAAFGERVHFVPLAA